MSLVDIVLLLVVRIILIHCEALLNLKLMGAYLAACMGPGVLETEYLLFSNCCIANSMVEKKLT